jgi:hypothetical protein
MVSSLFFPVHFTYSTRKYVLELQQHFYFRLETIFKRINQAFTPFSGLPLQVLMSFDNLEGAVLYLYTKQRISESCQQPASSNKSGQQDLNPVMF